MSNNTLKLDIDVELEKIIEKYNLDRHYPAYRVSIQAEAYLKNWIETLSEMTAKVLFITIDDSVLWMIRGWTTNENVSALQISSVEELDDHIVQLESASKIYIAAYTRTVEILHWLWRHDFHAESVYDILENQHIYCQMEFYRFFPPFIMSDELKLHNGTKEINLDGVALPLYEYYYQKQRLQYSISEMDKRRINEKLFFLAIYMKNFIEAEKILRAMGYEDEYEKCWQEVKMLLDKIRDILAQQKQKHIIIYWLDALSFKDAEKLEYLQEQREHSLYFHNAFTVTPHTFPTFKNMFFGIRQVDDLGYKVTNVELDESTLIRDITAHGYDFRLMSNYLNRHLKSKDIYNHYGRQIMNAPCSEAFWSLAKQMIQNGRPTVYLVHALVELHSPCLSVQRESFDNSIVITPEVLQVQCDELNGQLRFYDQMLGDSSYRIYMGDHGVDGMILKRVHVCFQVYHAAWKNKEVDKLFCFLDFPNIMHRLLAGEEIDDATWDREYVPVQDVDYYNPDRLKYLLKKVVTMEDAWSSYTAYKGAVTGEYFYAYFKTGNEIFHKWSDGEFRGFIDFNNLEGREDSAFFEELRKKAGGFPKELDTDPKFKYSKNTYILVENIKRTIREAVKLLDQKLTGEGYAAGSIVLRPGGMHTMQLYSVLSKESRKKIGGIIDRNSDCLAKDLGYTIYQPEDELPGNIKAVLLSTYENMEVLKYETQRMYSNLEVIDIYQYWKDCGYAFTRDFWCGLESDLDIDFLKE